MGIERVVCLDKMEQLVPLIRETVAMGKSIRIAPMGTSMQPMLRQEIDSVVLSAPPQQLRRFDLPLYRRDSGQYILHRVVSVENGYTCVGDNQFQLEKGIRHDQVIAVVTGFYKTEKYNSVSCVSYRVYCCLWHYSRPLRRFYRRGKSWLRRHIFGNYSKNGTK